MPYHKHPNSDTTDLFGFWIYILSDCILFAMLFATFVILRDNVYGGPLLSELIKLPAVFLETLFLLTSSLTYGLAILALYRRRLKGVLLGLSCTFLLGFCFVAMEASEFLELYREGHSWQDNASLSSFFTLVGTHGLHVSLGLVWLLVLIIQLLFFRLTPMMQRRLTYLGLFWTFLDLVWIFVFTVVYLMGAS